MLLPLLEISPLADHGAAARRRWPASTRYAMVAFVSPNAIDAAFAHIDALAGRRGASRCWARAAAPRWRATASTDANATIVSPRDPSRSDSENLLQALDLAALAGKRVLIVRGESGRELMADGLRAAGAEVTTVAAYRRSVPALTPALARDPARLAGSAQRLDNHQFRSAARPAGAGGASSDRQRL